MQFTKLILGFAAATLAAGYAGLTDYFCGMKNFDNPSASCIQFCADKYGLGNDSCNLSACVPQPSKGDGGFCYCNCDAPDFTSAPAATPALRAVDDPAAHSCSDVPYPLETPMSVATPEPSTHSSYASTPLPTDFPNRTAYSCDGPVHVTAPLCAAFCAGQNNATTDCCEGSACVIDNDNHSPGEGFCDCKCGGDPALPAAGPLAAPGSPGGAYKSSSCPVSTDFACNMDADDNSLCVGYCAGHENSFAQFCQDSSCLPNHRSGESFCNCACITPPGPMQPTVLPFPTFPAYPLPGSSTLSPVVKRAITSEPPKPAASDVTSYSCGGMSSVAKPVCVAYCSGLYNATADCCGDSLCAGSSEGGHCVCLCNVTH